MLPICIPQLFLSVILFPLSHLNPCPSGVVQLSGWQPAVPGNVLLAPAAPGHSSTPPQPFIGLVGAPQ